MNDQSPKDYYATLGLDSKARHSITAKDIRDAYRKIARKCHPDPQGKEALDDPAAVTRARERQRRATLLFEEINEAYAVLGDSRTRLYYDQFGSPDAPVRHWAKTGDEFPREPEPVAPTPEQPKASPDVSKEDPWGMDFMANEVQAEVMRNNVPPIRQERGRLDAPDLAGRAAVALRFANCEIVEGNLNNFRGLRPLFENIRGAGLHLNDAFLYFAKFLDVDLTDPDLSGALGRNPLFSGGQMTRAKLSAVGLWHPLFEQLEFRERSEFSHGTLQCPRFKNVKFLGQTLFNDATIEGQALDEKTGKLLPHFAGDVTGTDCIIENGDFSGVTAANGLHFRNVTFKGVTRFTKAHIPGSTIECCRFQGPVHVEGADMTGVPLMKLGIPGGPIIDAYTRYDKKKDIRTIAEEFASGAQNALIGFRRRLDSNGPDTQRPSRPGTISR